MQTLWLKTAINVLYSFGKATALAWHMYMHLALGASVCALVNFKPYINKADEKVELVALLALAAVTHVASLGADPGTTAGRAHLGIVAGLAAVPFLALALVKVQGALRAPDIPPDPLSMADALCCVGCACLSEGPHSIATHSGQCVRML